MTDFFSRFVTQLMGIYLGIYNVWDFALKSLQIMTRF